MAGFVLGESCLIAAVGGALGLLLVKLLTLRGDPTVGLLPVFYPPGPALLAGAALALVVGILAGLLPALAARR